MAWCFVEDKSVVHILDLSNKKRSSCIENLTEGPTKYIIKIKLFQGIDKFVDTRNFKAVNEFSQSFSSVLESRTAFVKTFRQKVQSLNTSENSLKDLVSDSLTMTDNETEERMDTLKVQNSPAPSLHIAREKVIGDCVKVHLSNLRSPPEDLAVRPMNPRHVETLRAAYMSGGKQFKLLAAKFVSGDLAKAMVSGAAELQVLGGNHTKAALQSLYSSGMIGAEVFVTVYHKDISAIEALAIGVYHNDVDSTSLSMTFMDKAGIIRKIKRSNGTRSWSRSAMLVFGYKSTAEVRTKLRTMAALADVDDEVWSEIQKCVALWIEKKPLTQTAFTHFVTLERDEQLKMLQIWVNAGYKEYLKELHCSTAPKKRVQSHSEKQVEKRSLDDDSDDNCRLKNEVKKLKEESRNKDDMIKKLQDDNFQLQTEKLEQTSTIEKLRSEVKKLSKEVTEMKENSENVSTSIQDVESLYNVGEKVWAYYEPNDQAYPAIITAIEGNMYRVTYIEDGVIMEVSDDGLWKFNQKK